MKRIAQILLTALVAAAAQVASAITYSPSDLLLVFHQSGYSDVLLNIGPAANFTGLTAGSVVPVSYDTNLVTTNFGGTLSGVSFAVVGEKDSQGYLWLTDTATNTTPGDLTTGTYAPLQTKINAVGVNAALITGNNASPLVIDPSDFNSYSYTVSPGDAGSVSVFGGDAPFTVSAVYPATSAFYRLIPTSYNPTPAAVKLGTFTMAAGGAISFTASAVTPVITGLSGPGVTTRGSTATYTASAEGATGFQWYYNGVAVAGATNSSLTVSNVQPGDIGNYTVVANNAVYTTSTTSPAKILKVTPNYISTDLLLVFHDGVNPDMEFNLGSVSNFQNQAAGTTKSVNYNKSLVLANFGGSFAGVTAAFVAESDSPQARVWLSDADLNPSGPTLTLNTYATLQTKANGAGVVGGSIVPSLDFNNPLTIAPSDPNSYSSIVSPGDANSVGSFGGDAPYNVGKTFPGYSGFYQLQPNLAGALAGVFALEANGDITFTSLTNTSFFAAAGAPTITTQPAPATLSTNQGANKTYTVVATNNFLGGSGFALAYQWKHAGTNIPDATNSTYTVSNLQSNNTGAYTVIVSSLLGSTNSGTANLALIPDSTLPTVVIATVTPVGPGGTKGAIGNPALTVSGTAKDDKKVITAVYYGIDGGAVSNLATGTTNWSASLADLSASNHTVVAQSKDLAGNLSLPKTNTFFHAVYVPLVLNTNNPDGGAVAHNGAVTFGTVSNTAQLVVGKTYKVKVTAAGNFLFSNIVDSVQGASAAVAPKTYTHTFTMSTGLTLTVNFATNRFFDMAGTYYGLITGTGGVAFADSGFYKVKVTSKTNKLATFSGTVYVGGNSKGFAGSFGLNGTGASAPVDRTVWGKDPLTVRLTLPFDTSDTISGSVSNNNSTNGWVSSLAGDRSVTNSVDGQYTMIIPGDPTNSANVPGGYGYGLVNITNGVVKAPGSKLADYQNFAPLAANVTKHGRWPLYSRGDSVGGGQFNSFIMGEVTVSNGLTGALTWIKVTNLSAGVRYPNGFAAETDIQGSPYFFDSSVLLNGSTRVIELSSGSNGVVRVEGAGLTGILTNLVSLNTSNKFLFGTGTNNPQTFKLSLVPKTGKITGSFKPTDLSSATTPIYGVVSTNANIIRGFFLPSAAPNDKKSGSLEVDAN